MTKKEDHPHSNQPPNPMNKLGLVQTGSFGPKLVPLGQVSRALFCVCHATKPQFRRILKTRAVSGAPVAIGANKETNTLPLHTCSAKKKKKKKRMLRGRRALTVS